MDYSFGSWIKRRRKSLDLSQQDLAHRVGCSLSAIVKIESDARRPSRQVAELLAEHLQIPPEQRPQFLKVARQEKMVDSLEPLPVPLEPFAQPVPTTPDSNLPQALNPLVGREHELSLVVQQLNEPDCRALTLTGLGGVGKTRLALEAASRLRKGFDGGVFFVPLAGVGEAGYILPAIADALGFPFSGAGNPKDQLLNYLREKEILLVLDNFEHLLDGVELVVNILQGAPRVKLLVTSREPLYLQAEWAFEVQGLPVPQDLQDMDLEASSAVLLFVQRARQARFGFELAAEERPAVARICQLVEGLPLGIELAAAWVRALSCQDISIEIERNLDFLKASARDIPERHRSLRAALDHSWNLLSEREKEVFRRLSVFQGGFRREAAQAVAEASLGEITSLLDKSLLKRAGENRYDLHEIVGQYATSHLQTKAPEYNQTHDRHSSYYVKLLEHWERQIRSPRQLEILTEMGAEMDNLRLAWSWMLANGQFANIQKSLHCLWHFHEIQGRFQEGEALLKQAVEALQSTGGAGARPDAESQVVHGMALAQYAYFCIHLGRYEQAGALLQQSLVLLRATTDRAALADTMTFLSYLQYRQGEFRQASQSALESLDLNRELEIPVGIVYCLVTLSYIYLAQGDYERAYALSKESLAICRELGDPHGTADSLITLSRAARQMGQYGQAGRWAQEALEISQAANDRWSAGQTLRQLGLMHFELGEVQEAVDLLRQSISLFREVGDRPLMARALIDLAGVACASGSHSESKQSLLEALSIAMDTQSFVIALQALVEIAAIEMKAGDYEQALELVIFSQGSSLTNPELKSRAGQLRAELEAQLTHRQIQTAQTQAQDKTLESLAQEILGANNLLSPFPFS